MYSTDSEDEEDDVEMEEDSSDSEDEMEHFFNAEYYDLLSMQKNESYKIQSADQLLNWFKNLALELENARTKNGIIPKCAFISEKMLIAKNFNIKKILEVYKINDKKRKKEEILRITEIEEPYKEQSF